MRVALRVTAELEEMRHDEHWRPLSDKNGKWHLLYFHFPL
jgi:hypothetical protein